MKDELKDGYVHWKGNQFAYLKTMFDLLQGKTKKKLYLNATIIEAMERLVADS